MTLSKENKTHILFALFVGAIVAANLIGGKIANFGLFEASVGILAFPITFLVTDIIEEVYGKEKTKSLVNAGMITLGFVLLITFIAVKMPFAARSYVTADQFNPVFGISLRFMIASFIAFVLAQYHDIWAFNFWKQKTKGKHLWLRNNLSTMVSQFIDSTVFMFIGLYYLPFLPSIINTNPKFTVAYLFTLIIPYWIVKMVFAAIDTPFCYLGVKWLKKE